MKKVFIIFALLLVSGSLFSQTIYIRGNQLQLRYGSEFWSVTLQGDSISFDGNLMKFQRAFGGDTLIVGADTVTRGGFYATDTLGVTSFVTLGDTLSGVGGGGGGSDTGYVKTTGDTLWGIYSLNHTTFDEGLMLRATATSIYFGANIANTPLDLQNTGMGRFTMGSLTTGSDNSGFGAESLREITDGYDNSAFGIYSLNGLVSGYKNSAFGWGSLTSNDSYQNSAFGCNSLNQNQTGYYNSAFGSSAMEKNATGVENTIVGARAMYNNTSGSGNVAIGFLAGFNEMGSNKLYIDNSNSATPLIYGEFDTDTVVINGDLGISGTLTVTDSISLADALLDSITSNQMRIGNITYTNYNQSILDDASITAPTAICGWGSVYIFNSGTLAEYGQFYFNTDGSVVLTDYSANTVTTDTDGKLCIIDNGTGFIIKNRLGGTRNIKIELKH